MVGRVYTNVWLVFAPGELRHHPVKEPIGRFFDAKGQWAVQL